MATSWIETERHMILDGAMGTMLQAAGLAPGERPEELGQKRPELLQSIHRAYIDAGADIITANTFGANAKKLAGSGIPVEEAVASALACARAAAAGTAVKVALDVGPLGELLEPVGTLAFEEAYALFAEVMRAGESAGADLVLIETMSDIYEVKAAVLAAKEQTRLPVWVSMTFEEDGRSFSGVPVEGFAAAIGAMDVAALGINCSLGPQGVVPLLRRLCAATALPVFAMPNAGLPNPKTGEYDLSTKAFGRAMRPCLTMGLSAVGGCCGTTPETITMLAGMFGNRAPKRRKIPKTSRVCGSTSVVEVAGALAIGERINPTGKKRLREALLAGDVAYLQSLAVQQQAAGAAILDVNVGAPGVDEVKMLPLAVKAVQAVSSLPLMLDSADPKALEAALRVCCGKPILNSTSGEEEKLRAILPLCRHYGAAVVGLAMDESGIPPTARGRLAVARRIRDAALAAGMPQEDVYIDCLTLSAGAQPEGPAVTLQAVELVKKLGVKTVLGVSNVSFGLPSRPLLNRSFLAMALQAGLDLAILNPADDEMMGTLAAFGLLSDDKSAAERFLARYGGDVSGAVAPAAKGSGENLSLREAIEKGLAQAAADAAKELLRQRPGETLGIVNEQLIPALDTVGADFEAKKAFLPQLLAAAGAAQSAFEVLRSGMGAEDAAGGPPVVVATVQGDVHDIGKNIARVLMENYGFRVIDLGRDVPPGQVLEAAQKNGARLVGLSALMTTTLPAMEKTIALLKERLPQCRILVGGAVLTPEYAKQIGADFYARDAKASADYARQVYGQ